MKIGRNDACWCGSGKKYKVCHMELDNKIRKYAVQDIPVPDWDMIKTESEIEGIRKAGKLNTLILDKVSEIIKEGISTEEINTFVHNFTIENGGIPAPLDYEGFPKSVCTSVNDVVCHGIPDENCILKSGDIVNVDVTTIVDGYFADASRMFLIGKVSEEDKKLVEVTKQCLEAGIAAVKPWGRLGDVGYIINKMATENGYEVVEDIGGHGTGLEFHEDPFVCHIGEPDTDILLVPGMVFTIEPMINMGTGEHYTDEENGWTVCTADGKKSAQWEHTILVTETGVEILTH